MAARPSRGASLLRTSRMFSMPQPLRGSESGLGLHRQPKTATTAFPLHLSVTTPETSRSTGDWGFKRPLPLRQTTKSSTPFVRVKQVDSIEAITDYGSAAGHTLTLEKFHEMNMPVSAPVLRYEKQKEGKVSVFEESSDRTVSPASLDTNSKSRRWKFDGPWLAGLSEEEFARFLKKKVRSRRAEFRQFLHQRRADELSHAASQKAMDLGADQPPRLSPSDISDEQLSEYIRSLRADRGALYALITQFLDLAPIAAPQTSTNVWTNSLSETLPVVNPYAQGGPPICHPSAGLSYLRTSSFVENHPLYGPQKQHSPVLSRILSPQRGPESPKLGMGGFVTEVPPGTTSFFHRYRDYDAQSKVQGLASFDPTISGGASVYLVPQSAKVSWNGKVTVKVDEATAEAQLVKKELSGNAEIYGEKKRAPREDLGVRDMSGDRLLHPRRTSRRPYFGGKSVLGSSKSYGLER
ncbi:uncharacterized protein DNG_08507 [Cephalotrichum gorgonifer]|uniref:Uncharacterized protein n=1 Tax=Cephalotrichum gorgonifer TaxID=2041049 RepID=A0AAE8SYF0_9PEZI|nr:uncharacterized protein DNG_08507 [Cephalotrichum gorgonifer]